MRWFREIEIGELRLYQVIEYLRFFLVIYFLFIDLVLEFGSWGGRQVGVYFVVLLVGEILLFFIGSIVLLSVEQYKVGISGRGAVFRENKFFTVSFQKIFLQDRDFFGNCAFFGKEEGRFGEVVRINVNGLFFIC